MKVEKITKAKTKTIPDFFSEWVKVHMFGFFVFNIVLLLLVLLNTAGYFHPFFIISINFIVFVALILAALLLGAGSTALFCVSIFFILVALFFKLALIDIWAERSCIYAFNSFFLGVVLLVWEGIVISNKKDYSLPSK